MLSSVTPPAIEGQSGAWLTWPQRPGPLLQRTAVSVLFARSDSCYFDLVDDVWDAKRDARGYTGSNPVVCHPPCRGWGRLRHFAKPRPDEKALALFAVEQIRRVGGVLEHPWGSTLWHAADLPHPGKVDAFGGWTLLVDQGWWGHPAPKPTYLYIVGCSREDLGELPVQLHRAAGRTMKLSPAEREATPPAFARFLVALAAKCQVRRLAVTAGQDRSYTDLAAPKRAASKRAAFKQWALEAQRPAEGAPPRGEVAGREARLSMLPDGNHGETLSLEQA